MLTLRIQLKRVTIKFKQDIQMLLNLVQIKYLCLQNKKSYKLLKHL